MFVVKDSEARNHTQIDERKLCEMVLCTEGVGAMKKNDVGITQLQAVVYPGSSCNLLLLGLRLIKGSRYIAPQGHKGHGISHDVEVLTLRGNLQVNLIYTCVGMGDVQHW